MHASSGFVVLISPMSFAATRSDLKTDPKEYTNLAKNPKFQKQLQKMKLLLANARKKAASAGANAHS